MPTEKKAKEPTSETPFERFRRLARKIANVPKEKADSPATNKKS